MPGEVPGDENASLILVMGITGAGKSYFVNKVAGKEIVAVGGSLDSCTETALAVPATIGREKVILVDTPGFDDTRRTDSEILTEISKLLSFQYEIGLKLKGVIYLHQITDNRFKGSAVKSLNICQKICGKDALKNVILVTTRWSDVEPAVGAERERELREGFWKYMLGFGSTMMRYHGDHDSAVAIASQLLNKSTIVLDLQRELVDEGKSLNQTTAGSLVSDNVEALKTECREQLRELEQLRKDLLESDREMKRQLQQDWATEKKKLELAQSQQVSLERHVGQEVREDIKTRKGSGPGKYMPVLLTTVNLLGLFVGIPPGTVDVFASWFSGTGIGESFTDLFASF